ncbi:hypothetical protein [Komarekiella delphini-convector]|uniref:hypothetical protein n=1 Tax=Komarekiella delphini-convector TaxID=3050158 RepID=UPI001CD8321F|nr:hypothetical protein [Komarekiella delphini-convector]
MKKLTFEEFLEQYPDGCGIYKLVDGEIVQVEATRAYKNIARYLVKRHVALPVETLQCNVSK